ncbi:MAG TPA: PAS domain S-box protein [Anaerolineae bacterium]|nr:PAS domain S-box protein [Anaerolineae bacterium]
MSDLDKTKKQLIEELESLRQRTAQLEGEAARARSGGASVETSLRESEEQQRRLLSVVSVGMLVTRMEDGAILYLNDATAQLFRGSLEDLKGQSSVIFYENPKDRLPLIAALRRDGYLRDYEVRFKRLDGDPFWASLSIQITSFGTEEEVLLTVVEDITARKQAEDEIRESEQRFRDIVMNTAGWVWEVNAEGQYTYCSGRVEEILGYSVEELLGKTPFDFMLPEEVTRIAPLFGDIVARKANIVDLENWNFRKDGTRVCLVTSGVALLDEAGNLLGYRGVDTDITAQRLAQDGLRLATEQQRAILETVPVGIAITSVPDNAVLYINPEFTKILGYTSEALLNKTVPDFYYYEEDSRKAFELMIAQNNVLENYEIYARRADGAPGWLSLSLKPILYRTDQTALLAVFTDITERKRIEAESDRFTTLLGTAAEIAAQVGAILDPDELLQTVIPLIKERFNLYYVHIYTLDEASSMLNLRAGYGEPGRLMLEKGHHIPMDREASLVATAARTKNVVLVNDVTTNPNFMPNPLLPDTKSEVAVPAIAGGQVLGVFDVQHDVTNYFTAADLDVFQTLATQIANVLQSAELFEQVQRQRTLYDGVLQNLPVGVWAVDNQFNVLLVNDAGRTMMGREIQDADGGAYVESYEVINVNTGELYDNAQLPLVKTVTQGGSYSATDAGVRWPDGTVVPQMINSGPLLDPQGKQVGGVVIFADATEQRRIQQEIERQRALYDSILQNLPVGVWAVDQQFNILLVNDTGRAMMGREVLDKEGGAYVEAYDVINMATGELYDNTQLPLVKAVTQGGTHTATDAGVRWPDGTVVPMLINAGPLLDPQGKQMGGVVIFADATEQKKAQTEIERLLTETQVRLDVSQALAGNLSEEKVLDILIQRAGVFPDARVTLNIIDQQEMDLTLILSRAAGFDSGLASATPLGTRFSAKYMPMVHLVKPGVPFVSPNVTTDERVDAMAKQLVARQGTVSLALIPMAVGSEWLGVLTVAAGVEDYFDDYKLHLYQTLADQGAVALRTARLRDAVQRSLLETDARLRVNQLLTGAQTEMAVLDAMVKVADFYPQAQVLISLVEEEGGVRIFNAVRSELFASGIPPVLQAGMRFSVTDFPLLEHVSPDKDLISNEVFADSRFDAASLALGEQMGVHSFAILPLIRGDEWVGTLTVAAKEPGFFDEHRTYLYRALVEQGASALHAARLRDQLSLTQFSVHRGPAAIYWLRQDASLYDVNETACQMLGYTREELLSIPRFTDLDPNFPPEAWAPHWTELKEKQRMVIQSQHRAKDGRLIPVEIEVNYLKYGDQEFNCAFARDITERLAAEEERTRLSAVLEATSDFVGIASPDGQGVYFNRGAREMIGLSLEADPRDYNIGMISAEAEMPRTVNEIIPTAIKEGTWSGESVIRALDGHEIPVLMTIISIKDSAGNLRYLANVSRDISAMRAAELERTRLASILENTNDLVSTATPTGALTYLNPAGYRLLGWSDGESLQDYKISDLHPVDTVKRIETEGVPEAIAKGYWKGETFLLRRDGVEVPVEQSIMMHRLADGEVQYMSTIMRDIRAAKQAETERARFTTQLSTAAQIAAQITTILDPDELFETVIPLMKERFGLYHVHFYGLEGDMLVLRAGYGRVGKIMKQQGFKIPMNREKSLVVRAARSGEIVWINDVTQEEGYLPNLLLPNTKSEVAVPAMIGSEVLGVLDVQADTVDAFSSSDLDVFRTLVGQIATAFQNARAFEQQRRAQAAQRDVAERVRAIFEAMTEGITVTNTLGQIEDMNEATLLLHRYAARDELLGRSAMELFARTDWGRASQGIRQALESGRSGTAEYKMMRKDGGLFDAEQNSALLRDAEGAPAGFVSITRDITERKRAEEALQLTRASVDATAAEIFWFTEDGRFTDVNQTACDRLGYTREELLTMGLFDIDPDFPAAAMEGMAAQIKSSGSLTLTSRHRAKDGRIFPVEISVYSVQFGEQTHYFVFAQDITERLRIEKEREQFTTQLRTAAEVSTQVGAILNPQELLELVVPLIAERFDLYHVHVYTLDEEAQVLALRVGSGEAGRIMREKGHAIPLDREQSLVARVARTHQPILVNDVTKVPDFMPNPLLPATRAELAVPLLVSERVLGVLDVQDDEPDRFTTGDMDVFTTLAGQIAAAFLTATSYDRVLEIDRLKGEFLANMSHELRTPMNSILGYTEVMLMGIDGELTPEMEEDVQAIFENGQQLLRLINDILDLTKIEAGRMTLTKELVDVLPILEDSRVNNLGLLHKRKTSVEIVIDADEELPFILADRVRLGQVLNNLVSNAVKFTEKGFIYLRAHQVGRQVVLEVEDTGMGISKEDQAKIFERFRQVDGSSTRRAEGTGLGLAISRSLVQMHGWELTLTSELGKGTKFSIYIPVEEDNAAIAN